MFKRKKKERDKKFIIHEQTTHIAQSRFIKYTGSNGNCLRFDVMKKTISLQNPRPDATLQGIYSDTKQAWKNHSKLIGFEFPFNALVPTLLEMKGGWTLTRNTRKYLKDLSNTRKFVIEYVDETEYQPANQWIGYLVREKTNEQDKT